MLRHLPRAWAVAALLALAAVSHAKAATYVNRDYYTDSQGRQQYNLVERHYTTPVAWNAADGPFIVERNVVVDATGSLTVGAGAVVQFNDDLALYVLGALNATGATFTSSRPQPEPGSWRGICFVAPSQGSALTNCTVSYGGNGAWDGGRYLRGNLTFHDAAANVSGCTVSYSKYDAVTCYGAAAPKLAGNAFRNSGECAVFLDSLACRPALSGNTAVANSWQGVYVRPAGDFPTDVTFYADLPYVFAETVNVPAGVTATVQEGAVLKFRGDRAFYVGGRLVANGSPQKRIVFTSVADDVAGGDTNSDGVSTSPAPGDWRCLSFYNEGSGTLSNCDVRYAGNGAWDGGHYQTANLSTFSSGDLSLSDCRLTDAKHHAALFGGKSAPRVTRCTFSRSEWGIVANEDAYLSAPSERRITGCSITGNSLGAVSMAADQVNALAPDNAVAGNASNRIEVYGAMRWSAKWDNQSPGAFYRVSDFVSVVNGLTLTVAPKVVVRSAPDKGIYVDGTLIADGVTFTSDRDQPSPGDWRSICFTGGQRDSRLTNCTIEYGGSGAWDSARYNSGNLVLHDTGPVTVSNCTIASSKTDGIRCYGANAPVLSGNAFIGNLSTAVYLDSLTSKPVMSGSKASGNGWNGVYVRPGGDLPGDTTLHADLPYVLASDIGVPTGATLTVSPGAVVKLCENRALYVNGILNAVGTADRRIVFTSWRDDARGGDTNAYEGDTAPAPSDWRCLAFIGDGSGTLAFCDIAYGGNGAWDGMRYEYGNVGVFTSGAVAVRDCHLEGGGYYGLYVTSGAPEVLRTTITGYRWGIVTAEGAYSTAPGQRLISSCVVHGNREGAASMLADQVDQIAPSTSIYGNTPNRVDVSGALRWRARWDNPSPGLFYRVVGHVAVPKGLALDVGPRATVCFESDKGLYVDGTLTADASVFTSAQAAPTPGYWRSICFTANQTDSSLTNCTVEYGGNGAWDGARYNHGNLTLDNAGQVRVTKCTVSNARYDGVKCYNASTPVISGTTFSGNASTAVALDGLQSLPVLGGNSATGNGWNGVYVVSGGNLPANAVLYADVPYLFTRTISVPEGGYLEVQPGAVVKFGGDCGLYVAGSMTANGTPAKRITFTSWRDDTAGGDTNQAEGDVAPQPGDWRSLVLQNTGTVSLSFADVRYGGNGAWDGAHYNHGGIQVIGGAAPSISYCTVARSRYDGIKTWEQARPYVRNVTVYDCAGGGLVTENASAPIVLNSIFASNYVGVMTFRDSKPTITYTNTFANTDANSQAEELVNGNWQWVKGAAIPGDTNMAKDPRFVDAPSLNLRLAAGSPMIDAGDPGTFDPVDARSRADLGAMPVVEESPPVVMGDLNGDGRVGINDATIALRIAVGLRSATQSELAAGDLNGDGRITIAEVTRILKIALGL